MALALCTTFVTFAQYSDFAVRHSMICSAPHGVPKTRAKGSLAAAICSSVATVVLQLPM